MNTRVPMVITIYIGVKNQGKKLIIHIIPVKVMNQKMIASKYELPKKAATFLLKPSMASS